MGMGIAIAAERNFTDMMERTHCGVMKSGTEAQRER